MFNSVEFSKALRLSAISLPLLALVMLAASCTHDGKMGKQSASLEQDNRQTLALCLHRSAQSGDWQAYAAAMDGEYRRPFTQMLQAQDQYVQKLGTLAGLVEQHIGPTQAKIFRDKAKMVAGDVMPSPLAGACDDGKCDWTKVEFLAEAEGYLVIVNHDDTSFSKQFLLQEKSGKWWLTPKLTSVRSTDHKAAFSRYAKVTTKALEDYSAITDGMIKDVRSGKINKDNFDQNMIRAEDLKKK